MGDNKIHLAKILDDLGMNGLREGDTGLYENQSLVVINYGKASAKEIKKFTDNIAKKVFKETKIKLMGDDWFAQAIIRDFIVHVLYTKKDKPIGEHEDVHLLSASWGQSIALFQEGLAEYLVGSNWYGQNHDILAKEGLEKNIFPSIKSMMEHKKWLKLPDKNVLYHYCFVGSFTKFLINKFGKEKFKKVYKKTMEKNTVLQNTKSFEEVYGIKPSDVEKMWKEFLM